MFFFFLNMAYSRLLPKGAFAIAWIPFSWASSSCATIVAPFAKAFLGIIITIGRACAGADKISWAFDNFVGEQVLGITPSRQNSSESVTWRTTRAVNGFRMLPWMPRANVPEEVFGVGSVQNLKKSKKSRKKLLRLWGKSGCADVFASCHWHLPTAFPPSTLPTGKNRPWKALFGWPFRWFWRLLLRSWLQSNSSG